MSVRTLSRARRVLRRVREVDDSPDAEHWSRAQVRIEWGILAAQAAAFVLSSHRMTTDIWNDARSYPVAFHVYGTVRVAIALILAWCVLTNKRAHESLQSKSDQ